jgi:hypothetical protein
MKPLAMSRQIDYPDVAAMQLITAHSPARNRGQPTPYKLGADD